LLANIFRSYNQIGGGGGGRACRFLWGGHWAHWNGFLRLRFRRGDGGAAKSGFGRSGGAPFRYSSVPGPRGPASNCRRRRGNPLRRNRVRRLKKGSRVGLMEKGGGPPGARCPPPFPRTQVEGGAFESGGAFGREAPAGPGGSGRFGLAGGRGGGGSPGGPLETAPPLGAWRGGGWAGGRDVGEAVFGCPLWPGHEFRLSEIEQGVRGPILFLRGGLGGRARADTWAGPHLGFRGGPRVKGPFPFPREKRKGRGFPGGPGPTARRGPWCAATGSARGCRAPGGGGPTRRPRQRYGGPPGQRTRELFPHTQAHMLRDYFRQRDRVPPPPGGTRPAKARQAGQRRRRMPRDVGPRRGPGTGPPRGAGAVRG